MKKNINILNTEGLPIGGECTCPKCEENNWGSFMSHSETPYWHDVHDDDMFLVRPVSILLTCHQCGSMYALCVITHKGYVDIYWQEWQPAKQEEIDEVPL